MAKGKNCEILIGEKERKLNMKKRGNQHTKKVLGKNQNTEKPIYREYNFFVKLLIDVITIETLYFV